MILPALLWKEKQEVSSLGGGLRSLSAFLVRNVVFLLHFSPLIVHVHSLYFLHRDPSDTFKDMRL